jgi:5-methylcytosine-specific restriction endonuclease McrA
MDFVHKARQPKAKKRHKPKFRDAFYGSWEWLKLRYEVLKAYGAVCMCCGDTGRIVIDHIKSRRRYPELQLEFDNLQVLCNRCNKGKSYDDETDWRPKLPKPELEEPEMQHLRDILGVY